MAPNIPEHIWVHVFSLTGHMTFRNFFNTLSPVSDHNNEDSNGLYLTDDCEPRMTKQGSVAWCLERAGTRVCCGVGAPTGASCVCRGLWKGKQVARGDRLQERRRHLSSVSFSLFRHHLEGWSCAVCFLQLNQCQLPMQVPCSFSEGCLPLESLC